MSVSKDRVVNGREGNMKYYLKEELFGINNSLRFQLTRFGCKSKRVRCSIKSAMRWYYWHGDSDLFSAVTKNGDKIFIDGNPGTWVAAYLKLPHTDCEVIIATMGNAPEHMPLKNVHGEGKISPEYTF